MTHKSKAAPAVLLALALLAAGPAAAQTPRPAPAAQGGRAAAPAGPAKMAQLLDQSGLSYTKVGEGAWTTKFQGESLGEFDVMIAAVPSSELVVVAAIVARKAGYKPSPELFQSLLRFNDAADQVKLGIDSDGDIFLRAEINGRLLDLTEFKAVVEQVAAAANQAHGQNKGSFAAR